MFFHITHVCNLTCENCDSYNNRNFKGHFYWEDYADYYYEWAKKLDINSINIIGGEPFANPSLYNWVTEIKKCFTHSESIYISTNGTYLKNNVELTREILEQGVCLIICVHDPAFRSEIESAIETILSPYDTTKISNNTTYEYFIDDKKAIMIYNTFSFWKNSTEKIENGITFFRRSDPVAAHEMCLKECGPANFFIRGKLYKCYLTAIAKDLTSQFKFEEEGANLLNSYIPADPFDSDEVLENFFNELHNPIKQCTLCAEKRIIKPIWPMPKKKSQF